MEICYAIFSSTFTATKLDVMSIFFWTILWNPKYQNIRWALSRAKIGTNQVALRESFLNSHFMIQCFSKKNY